MSVVYPCSQLLTLLLLRDEVLGGHLQFKLGQLMFPAHCPAKQSVLLNVIISYHAEHREPIYSEHRCDTLRLGLGTELDKFLFQN